MNYKTQSLKIPHEILKFQEKMLPLKTDDVQAMLLQSRVLKMNFPSIWLPTLKNFLFVPTIGTPH